MERKQTVEIGVVVLRKRKVWLLFLLLSCSTLLYESTGFADAVEKTINVTINSIKLVVNGTSIQSDNFIYNGTTYVPLRQVTETLGKQISWDDVTRTVEIKEGQPVKPTRYVGETKRDGHGTYTWPNGDKYVGEWKQGEMDGQGTLYYSSGEQYTGSFQHNKKNGKGKIAWKNNETYDGVWLNDVMVGQGTYNFANGDIYIGDWRNGKMSGLGTYIYHNGVSLKGLWQDNQFMANQGKE